MTEIRRLLRLICPFKWWMALAILLGTATVSSGIGLLATSAYLIAAAALHPSIAELQVAIVGVRFFGIARGLFRYLERYVSHTVTLGLLARWRVWFYEALEPLAPARLDQLPAGDLLSRTVADIETLQEFYVRVIAPPAVALLVGLGMTVWLSSFSPILAAVLLGSWLLAGLGVPRLLGRLARAPAAELIVHRAALHARLVDGIQGMPDWLAFGQGERVAEEIEAAGWRYASVQERLAWGGALQNGLGAVLSSLTMVLVLAISITMVNDGRLSGVYLAALALATVGSFEALLPLPQAAQSLSTARAAACRLFEIVDARPAVAEPLFPANLRPASRLEVTNLSFSYHSAAARALDGVSFTLEPGRRIAIVGPSGGGKTTLVRLLLRFWDFDQGDICLGGVSIRNLAAADVRRVIGVVSQHTYLFNTTIRENLLLASPNANEQLVSEAGRRARIHDFIKSLPKGYETVVGERGANLSGGERQRLALARALLRPTPILVLDEPTANLDPASEREFLGELFELVRDRALLLITHRLIKLERMDEILVLDHGRIAERGTEPALLARRGLYYRLWMLQNRAIEQRDPEE